MNWGLRIKEQYSENVCEWSRAIRRAPLLHCSSTELLIVSAIHESRTNKQATTNDKETNLSRDHFRMMLKERCCEGCEAHRFGET